MKYIVLLFVVMMSMVSVPSQASNIAQTLCEYVAVDDKKRMRSFLKSNKLKIRSVYKSIQCNNMDMLQFADNRSSTQVGAFLIGKLPKSVVSKYEGSFVNEVIQAAVTKRLS